MIVVSKKGMKKMDNFFTSKEESDAYLEEAEKMDSYFTEEEKWRLHQEYSTASRLRHLLLNMYNSNTFKEVDISGLMFNADDIHKKLFYKILNMDTSYINGSMFNEFENLIMVSKRILDRRNENK